MSTINFSVDVTPDQLIEVMGTIAKSCLSKITVTPAPMPAQPKAVPVNPTVVTPKPVQPVAYPTAAPAPIVPAPTAPAANPAPVAAPTAPAREYTLDDLAVAAQGLMDAGKIQELTNLLGQFNIQSMQQLPKESYGMFATALRGMGAKI